LHINGCVFLLLFSFTDLNGKPWVQFSAEVRGLLRHGVSLITYYQRIKFTDDNLNPFDYRESSLKLSDKGIIHKLLSFSGKQAKPAV